MSITVISENIKFLSTGSGGGHIYVRGKGTFENYGIVDIYAHFSNKQIEADFKRTFKGCAVEFISSRWDFMPEIGLSLWEVIDWKLIN